MLVDIGTLCTELLAVNSQAALVCDGLSDDQLAWRPQPGKWSIAENFIHLQVTTEVFLPAIDHALGETISRRLICPGPFRLGWYGRLLVWYVEPPPVIRLPAPKALRPSLSGHPSRVLGNFLRLQAAMQQRMEDAGGLNLTGLRFASPLARYIRMNLLEFFLVFNGHSRRHLWQAANVRQSLPSQCSDQA
jgi:DinB superfamily